AGDICSCGTEKKLNMFKRFIEYYADKFVAILHVAGNHEYYTDEGEESKDSDNHVDMQSINRTLKMLELDYPQYHYLNNEVFIYNDTVFAGTTLWSFIPDDAYDDVQKYMNDYVYIYY